MEATIPRDSSGVYALPSGYNAVTGQTVLASQHNPPLEDIAQSLTGSLPRNGAAPMLGNLPMAGFKVTSLAPGTADTDAVNRAQLVAGGAPVASILDFAGAIVPVGWLMCFGQAVSRTTYSELFAVVGTTYGVGDGATTFNLPDCRGRVAAGKDNMGGASANRLPGSVIGSIGGLVLGATGGQEATTLTLSQMPSHNHGGATSPNGAHNHSYTDSTTTGGGDYSSSGSSPATAASITRTTAAVSDHTHTVFSEGSNAAHNNIQPTIIFNKIIKVSSAG